MASAGTRKMTRRKTVSMKVFHLDGVTVSGRSGGGTKYPRSCLRRSRGSYLGAGGDAKEAKKSASRPQRVSVVGLGAPDSVGSCGDLRDLTLTCFGGRFAVERDEIRLDFAGSVDGSTAFEGTSSQTMTAAFASSSAQEAADRSSVTCLSFRVSFARQSEMTLPEPGLTA